ncbi:unnamed protein product [Parnassius apollo]|uniref:(apollo) hypothetical protein n=1 Tax=Parnassius apollo TaxID=110799 RepID=A0A8S3X4J3_PARAO|nr:unnamed protein product [Parnassius apollo]
MYQRVKAYLQKIYKYRLAHQENLSIPLKIRQQKHLNENLKKNMKDSSSETDDEGEIQYASDSTINLSDEFIADKSAAAAVDIPNATQFIPKPDDYVLVEYEGEQWPGQVKTVDDDGAFVSCMNRCGLSWKWPEKPDCIFYPMDKIISTFKTHQNWARSARFFEYRNWSINGVNQKNK